MCLVFPDQEIFGVRDGALVVLTYGGCFGDGGVEDVPHKLAEVESLLGGVFRRALFSLTCGLGDTCLLLGLLAHRTAVECKQLART
jgi:hypothetical protein